MLKPNYFKSVLFFDVSMDCVCQGIKDNNGEPIRYESPLSLTQALEKLVDLNPAFNLPLAEAEAEAEAEADADADAEVEAIEAEVHEAHQGEEEQGEIDEEENNERDRPARKYSNGKLEVYLQDFRSFDDYFVLLVNSTDLNSSHNVARDTSDGRRFEQSLGQTQGADLSSHIVIFKDVHNDRQLCLIERAAGLTIAVLKSFLDFLGKEIVGLDKAVFEIDHPEGVMDARGVVKKRVIWPRHKLQGHPSESFFEDIAAGRMQNMHLVGDPQRVRGMDNAAPPEFSEIAIRVAADTERYGGVPEMIRHALNLGRDYNLDSLRVCFTDATGSTHTRKIDLGENLQNDNMSYVKKRRFGLFFRPKSSYVQVNPGMIEKILGVVDE